MIAILQNSFIGSKANTFTSLKFITSSQQYLDQLAAGAHQRRPLRQLPGNQRRLGSIARTLLGHAAADLGMRGDRQAGSRPQLRRLLAKPGLQGTHSGRRRKKPTRHSPTI